MAAIDCAQIDYSVTPNVVLNAITMAEEDFTWLSAIWADFFPGQGIAPINSLVPAAGYPLPVWIGWVKNPDDTWYDPNYNPDNFLD